MKALVCLLNVSLLTFCKAFTVQGPSGPLVAQLGGSVLLPCSAETPLPLEDLEVQWRRTDSESLVHLFQEGEERPESQDYAYSGRAHFITEGVSTGNYSLLLTDVTRADAEVYICKVYTNLDSSEITAEIKYIEHLAVIGAGAASGYVGEEAVLNCSVDSHVAPEKLDKVTWNRTNQEVLVLLFQNGEVLSNSSHERYQGRAEFFISEIPKGNFSLRLKDVRPDDTGEYICEAQSGHLSANTTAVLQGLGSPPVLICASVLCFIALAMALGLGVPVSLNLTSNVAKTKRDNEAKLDSSHNDTQRVTLMHLSLIFCPNTILFIAFMLYGVTLGFLGEILTCAVVNLIRFFPLLKSAQYLHILPASMRVPTEYIKYFDGITGMLEYYIIAGVLFSGVFADISVLGIDAYYVGFIAGMYLLFYFLEIFGENSQCSCFTYVDMINWILLWLLVVGYSTFNIYMFLATLAFTLGMDIFFHCTEPDKSEEPGKSNRKYFTIMVFIFFVICMILFLCHLNWILADVKDGAGLMCGTLVLYILTAISGFRHSCLKPDLLPDTSFFETILYICGAAGLAALNSTILAVDLIVRLWTGSRLFTDLRLIVLSIECVFTLGRLALKLYIFWKGSITTEAYRTPCRSSSEE